MYRSLLFIPATEEMLPKIKTCRADAIIIDLEDSIAEKDKERALHRTVNFFAKNSFDKDIYVRINPNRMDLEVESLKALCIKGFMLPKTETCESIWQLFEISEGKEIVALIETAMGIINLPQIASQQEVTMLAFGAEDYTTQCGIKNDNDFLAYPKSKIVIYGKAYHKPTFDTISTNISDQDAYIANVQLSYDYGFDGKLAIHPMQVDVINQIFKISDIEYYKNIVSQFEQNEKGVLKIDDQIFEKPHIDAMKRKIAEYECEGKDDVLLKSNQKNNM